MKMTYDDLEDIVKNKTSLLKRLLKYNVYSPLEVSSSILHSVFFSMLIFFSDEEMPQLIALNEEEKLKYQIPNDDSLIPIYKVMVLSKEYIIYNDDYGQCMCMRIGDDYISFGTYNSDIIIDVVYTIFIHYVNNELGEKKMTKGCLAKEFN